MTVGTEIANQPNTANPVKTSEDAFHRGEFTALQPVGSGHRAGSDALLIAASLPADASGLLADMGAGSGVAALAALNMNPQLRAVLIEKNPVMAELARKTLQLRSNLRFAGRVRVLEADITFSGEKREACGLKSESFDHAIMNPPYNHDAQRASPDMMKAEAHMMGLFGLDSWMRTAVAILKPSGTLTMIYRSEKIGEINACCQGRFGGLSIVPVHGRADEPAKRVLVNMRKGSRAPLTIMPGIVTHDDDGKPTALAEGLMNGLERVSFAS